MFVIPVDFYSKVGQVVVWPIGEVLTEVGPVFPDILLKISHVDDVMEIEFARENKPLGRVDVDAAAATPEKVVPAKRRRRSNSISVLTSSLSTSTSKENVAKTPPTATEPTSCPKRRRNVSGSGKTFWGWSPGRAKFKPKVRDRVSGKMIDPPDSEALSASFKSKWLQVSSTC